MSELLHPILKSSPLVHRYQGGKPILTKADVPYAAECIFNAGVAKYQGQYVMVFRNDFDYKSGASFGGSVMGIAFSNDGIQWKVRETPFYSSADMNDPEITRVYDPRLTVMDGKCYLTLAVDTRHGLRGAVAVTEDFEHLEFLSMSSPDNRNMVLFPEKIGGLYTRLERPFPVYSRGGKDRFDTWISRSPDLRYWGDSKLLFAVEDIKYANDKVGPGAPPVKTEKGWLTLFHAVDRDESRGKNGWENVWKKRYWAGIMLLDLEDPSKIVGIYDEPLLAPETHWEVEEGFRTNTIFPGGMILEDSGEVKIYYGAADNVECLATADVHDLLKLCGV